MITYLILPLIKYAKGLRKSEAERINEIFNPEENKKMKKNGDN